MVRTIQIIAVTIAALWALLAAMMNQSKEQALNNLRTWLPDSIVDVIAAMPEPLIAHRTSVYAALATVAVGLLVGPTAYRIATDRDKRLGMIERSRAYIVRLKEDGLSTFAGVSIAVLLAALLFVAQSWLLLGIISGGIAFVALRRLSSGNKTTGGQPNADDTTQKFLLMAFDDIKESKDKLSILREEVKPLLFATIYNIYVSIADKLLSESPGFKNSDVIVDPSLYSERKVIAEKFVSDVVRAWRHTRFFDGLTFHLQQAENEAEMAVKQTPQEKRPTIDHLDFRVYAIAIEKAHVATIFLKKVKSEAGDDYRLKLQEFIEMYGRYEGKGK